MPNPVIDLGSNLEENLKRWSNALKGVGDKLAVWEVVYSGKRKWWSAKEISSALGGKVTPKRVTEVGKQLIGEGLVRQVPERYPIVYEKIPEVHHYKGRILALARSKTKRNALATKRDRGQVTINLKQPKARHGEAIEITIDDIDQFRRVRKPTRGKRAKLLPLPESRFKRGLQRLFKDIGEHKDWGGEKTTFTRTSYVSEENAIVPLSLSKVPVLALRS